MRRSARLRSVMLRATKMQPWKRGSSADITEPESDTGNVWPDLGAHRQLEHLVGRLLDIEVRAVLVGDHVGELAAEQLPSATSRASAWRRGSGA